MNRLWTRVFVIAAGILLLLFLSNDFGLIDIQKTAIVAAIGIDAAEEGGNVNVTAQIAVPDASGANKAGNVTIRNARTVGEAMAEINRKTGWYPTLVHCRLIVLGEDAAEEDVFDVLNYFLRSEFVEDSCLVAMCEGTAEDLFSAKSPIGEMTALAVAKVLSSEAQKTGLVCVTNLRDFAKGYYSPSSSGFLPMLSVMQEAESEGGQGGQTAFGPDEGGEGVACAAEGGQGQGKSGAQNAADVFDASRTVLFYRGRRADVLEAGETLAFNLTDTPTDFAYGDVQIVEDGETVFYNLRIRIESKKAELSLDGGAPALTFRVRANAQIADASRASGVVEIAKTAFVPDFVLRAAEETFRRRLESALAKASAGNCDLFGLRQQLHRRYPAQEERFSPTLLQDVKAVYDIRFDTVR